MLYQYSVLSISEYKCGKNIKLILSLLHNCAKDKISLDMGIPFLLILLNKKEWVHKFLAARNSLPYDALHS